VLRDEEPVTLSQIPHLAPVALTVDLPEHGLTPGQMGSGRTQAMAPVKPDQLMVLHRGSEAA
jgi:hypothetical protein